MGRRLALMKRRFLDLGGSRTWQVIAVGGDSNKLLGGWAGFSEWVVDGVCGGLFA